jgi:hypothetical protein
MIVMPLDSRTQILALDPSVYRIPRSRSRILDVVDASDVDMLNSLQVYAARESVYFSDAGDADYVAELLASHPAGPQDHRGGFNVLRPLGAADAGATQGTEILHTFEPQFPVTLGLSFLRTAAVPPGLDLGRPRRPRVIRKLEQGMGFSKTPSPIGIDEIVKWVESELVVTPDT